MIGCGMLHGSTVAFATKTVICIESVNCRPDPTDTNVGITVIGEEITEEAGRKPPYPTSDAVSGKKKIPLD